MSEYRAKIGYQPNTTFRKWYVKIIDPNGQTVKLGIGDYGSWITAAWRWTEIGAKIYARRKLKQYQNENEKVYSYDEL